ncbi:MAG: hypothetical protein CMJ42_08105 [Phyllobacteriaceae bacterium]|nr:hypothetical protein [Phyllobacteriaceae bacterium]MBA89731.1 hypothetical protein [Phyllobacteriaceae bacterium]
MPMTRRALTFALPSVAAFPVPASAAPSPVAAMVERWERLADRVLALSQEIGRIELAIRAEFRPGVKVNGRLFRFRHEAEDGLGTLRHVGQAARLDGILAELDRQDAAEAEALQRAGIAEMEAELTALQDAETALEDAIAAAPVETLADARAKADFGSRFLERHGQHWDFTDWARLLLKEIASA